MHLLQPSQTFILQKSGGGARPDIVYAATAPWQTPRDSGSTGKPVRHEKKRHSHRDTPPLHRSFPQGRSPGSRVIVYMPAFPARSQWRGGHETCRSQLRGQPQHGLRLNRSVVPFSFLPFSKKPRGTVSLALRFQRTAVRGHSQVTATGGLSRRRWHCHPLPKQFNWTSPIAQH